MKVPDHLVAEIVDGELFTSPRPAARHARAESVIIRALDPFDRPPGDPGAFGGWWILVEPELHFAQDVLVPDLAGWRQDRMPQIPDVAAFTLAPDWVCEVISPSTGRLDRSRKMAVYAREQIQHLWFVDPILRTVEVYSWVEGRWLVAAIHDGDVTVRAEPFDAIEMDLTRWWLPPPP